MWEYKQLNKSCINSTFDLNEYNGQYNLNNIWTFNQWVAILRRPLKNNREIVRIYFKTGFPSQRPALVERLFNRRTCVRLNYILRASYCFPIGKAGKQDVMHMIQHRICWRRRPEQA